MNTDSFAQPSEWNLSLTSMFSVNEQKTNEEVRETRETRETTDNTPDKKYNPSSKFYDIYFRKYN